MKAIAVLAYNRPDYLRQTLASVAACRGIKDYDVVVSVDDGKNQKETAKVACSFPHVNVKLLHYRLLGINGHPRWVYDILFRNHDFIVAIEDDVLPSPDALELCDWFHDLPEKSQYACLNLYAHGNRDQANPLAIAEVMRFCPWGWALTRDKWNRLFRPAWMCDPRGWDFSIARAIEYGAHKVLMPLLSRTTNIGREGGTNMTAGHWDEHFAGLVASDGTHGTAYEIVQRLQLGYEKDIEECLK